MKECIDTDGKGYAATGGKSGSVTGYKATLDAIEKAMQHVFALCDGREKWTMRVPVDENRDSDCVIMAALTQAKKIIEAL